MDRVRLKIVIIMSVISLVLTGFYGDPLQIPPGLLERLYWFSVLPYHGFILQKSRNIGFPDTSE